MKPVLLLPAFFLALLTAARLSAQTPQQAMSTPACNSNQLSLIFDSENGSFDGMSHGGTLLVLRNIDSVACSLLPRPELSFADAAHKPVPFAPAPIVGMHPGPVQVPVVIPPGAEVTAAMRWTAGDVYDGHNCVQPAFLTLKLKSDVITAAFSAHACGPAGKPVPYTIEFLRRDPAYTPAAPHGPA